MTNETPQTTNQCCSQVDDCVRANPTRALLVAVGAGIALGLIIRSIQPQPAKRGARLFEDLRGQLQELSERISVFVKNRDDLMEAGVDRVRDLHLDRNVCSLGKRIRSLFS